MVNLSLYVNAFTVASDGMNTDVIYAPNFNKKYPVTLRYGKKQFQEYFINDETFVRT